MVIVELRPEGASPGDFWWKIALREGPAGAEDLEWLELSTFQGGTEGSEARTCGEQGARLGG